MPFNKLGNNRNFSESQLLYEEDDYWELLGGGCGSWLLLWGVGCYRKLLGVASKTVLLNVWPWGARWFGNYWMSSKLSPDSYWDSKINTRLLRRRISVPCYYFVRKKSLSAPNMYVWYAPYTSQLLVQRSASGDFSYISGGFRRIAFGIIEVIVGIIVFMFRFQLDFFTEFVYFLIFHTIINPLCNATSSKNYSTQLLKTLTFSLSFGLMSNNWYSFFKYLTEAFSCSCRREYKWFKPLNICWRIHLSTENGWPKTCHFQRHGTHIFDQIISNKKADKICLKGVLNNSKKRRNEQLLALQGSDKVMFPNVKKVMTQLCSQKEKKHMRGSTPPPPPEVRARVKGTNPA